MSFYGLFENLSENVRRNINLLAKCLIINHTGLKDRCRKYRIPRIADNQLRDLREIRSLLYKISMVYESYSYHILIS